MNELIKVTQNEQGELLVSARELYEGLKVEKAFSTWIQTQLENVDAIENEDYHVFWYKVDDSFKEVVEFNGNINSMVRNGNQQDYVLKIDIAKEICMVVGVAPRTNDETKKLSKQVRKYFIECERKLKEVSVPSYQIVDPIARAEKWIEEEKQRQKLLEDNKKLTTEVIHKEDVIVGLVGDISLCTKRRRISDIVRYKAKNNYSQRWNFLYAEFEKKYHIDLKRRIANCDAKPKIKNKIDYIERELEMIPELYEIACKIFEQDVEELKKEWDLLLTDEDK